MCSLVSGGVYQYLGIMEDKNSKINMPRNRRLKILCHTYKVRIKGELMRKDKKVKVTLQ